MSAERPSSLSGQLRRVIKDRGLTAYEVGRISGVDPGMITRFLSGERDIRLSTADRIAAALGLGLVEGPDRREERRPIVPFSEQLADLIRTCGIRPSTLARTAGIEPSILSRFLRGRRTINSATVDAIAAALGGIHIERAGRSIDVGSEGQVASLGGTHQ